jgi:hypothetical protein
MRSVSIRALMFLVLVLALGVAALRNADDNWAGGTLMATALLLGLAALGTTHDTASRRASRLGFVVFGGGYFALAFLGLSESNLARLPTSRLLAHVHQRVAPLGQNFALSIANNGTGQGVVLITSNPLTRMQANKAGINVLPTGPAAPANSWARLLPGAAQLEPFSTVGHCLYAILAGLLGSAIMLAMKKRWETGGGEPDPSIASS